MGKWDGGGFSKYHVNSDFLLVLGVKWVKFYQARNKTGNLYLKTGTLFKQIMYSVYKIYITVYFEPKQYLKKTTWNLTIIYFDW